MTIRKRLEALDLSLPAPRKPAFSYQAVVVDQGLAWVSGQLPWQGDSMDLVHTHHMTYMLELGATRTPPPYMSSYGCS